jgi:hypothetical protein
MNGGSLGSCFVRFIAHGVDAACIDPAIVEIEQGADGDRIVDCFVGESGGVECFDIGGLDGNGITIHFSDEPKESFLGRR